MSPNRPPIPPGVAMLDPDERDRRLDATVRRLRTGAFSDAKDLVERWDAVADRSLEVYEQIGEIHGAASSAEKSADAAREAAEETRAAFADTRQDVAELREDVRIIVRRLDAGELPHRDGRRPKLPSLSEYNPDYTPAGGIKLDPDEFAKLQKHVADQDARAALAEAEKRGAEKALAAAEAEKKKADEARERTQRRHVYFLTLATAAAGGGAWLLTHFLHL